jgi:hypothetical protein
MCDIVDGRVYLSFIVTQRDVYVMIMYFLLLFYCKKILLILLLQIYMLIINNTTIRVSIENLQLLQQIFIRKARLSNNLSFSARQLFRKQAFL